MLILVAADALPADEHLGPRVADAPVADLREGAADAVARRRDVAQVALDRVLGHVALEAVDALAVHGRRKRKRREAFEPTTVIRQPRSARTERETGRQ